MGKVKPGKRSRSHPGRGRSAKAAAAAPAKLRPVVKARATGGKKPAPKRPSRKPILPRKEEQFEPVHGIPDEAQIEEKSGPLSAEDRDAFRRVQKLLAEHLGSRAAARLWLVTPAPGFVTTPLEAVRNGQARLVLEMLEAQWGPSPTYA